tara:strand:+ start:884 stop:1075 length:192 start_codon:yes stop_codon:yes gene_type:complete
MEFHLNELDVIQKLDQIISDLNQDGLLDIANNLEIQKQKIVRQFNQAELNSQQIDIEELINNE